MKTILFALTALFLFNDISYTQEQISPVTRNIKTYKGEIIVVITVYCSSLYNKTMKAAKIMETIPEGCSCHVTEDAGSVVSIKNDHLKMLWFDLPSVDFHVKYVLTCQNSIDNNLITGEFSYIENDETIKKLIIENNK